MEHRREVGARRAERRRELERAAQQRLGIGVAAEPPGELGEHPHRRDVGRLPLEPRPQQPFGDREPPFASAAAAAISSGSWIAAATAAQCAASPPAVSPAAMRRSPSACHAAADRGGGGAGRKDGVTGMARP